MIKQTTTKIKLIILIVFTFIDLFLIYTIVHNNLAVFSILSKLLVSLIFMLVYIGRCLYVLHKIKISIDTTYTGTEFNYYESNFFKSNKKVLKKFAKAYSYYYKKQYQQAILYFSEALELDESSKDQAILEYFSGNCFMYINKSKAAINKYSKALAKEPDFTEALINLGIQYDEQGEPALAFDCFLKASKQKNESLAALNNMAVSHIKAKSPEKAVDFLNRAIEFKPVHPTVLGNNSLVHAILGNHDISEKNYKLAIANGYNNSSNLKQALDTIRSMGPASISYQDAVQMAHAVTDLY